MSENFKSGVVTEVHATDKDELKNAELTFQMASSDQDHFKIVTIGNRGIISVSKVKDIFFSICYSFSVCLLPL